jgi:hypothetical protein
MRCHFVYSEHSATNISRQVMWNVFVRSEMHTSQKCSTYQTTNFWGGQTYCTWLSVLCSGVSGVAFVVVTVMYDKCGVHSTPSLKSYKKIF